MLRVTTLYASSAAATALYYTRYLTQADGELPGRWTGRQADLLGLPARSPPTHSKRCWRAVTQLVGHRSVIRSLDRVTKSGKMVRAVAGFDATFSAPKSLSVWWALTGDDGLAECHDTAVRAVVDWIDRYGSTTRIRSNGHRLHPDTQGLTAAVFRQTTSRLDDPQLHSHVVISSKVQTADGRWLALDARTLKGFQRALGGIYQSVLRAEVTARYRRRLGRHRQGASRDRRHRRRRVGGVLETDRTGRHGVPSQAGGVLGTRGTRPDPERTRRPRPRSRRRHPRAQDRQRCHRSAVTVAHRSRHHRRHRRHAHRRHPPHRTRTAHRAATRHRRRGGRRARRAAFGVASPRCHPNPVRHRPPATRRRRHPMGRTPRTGDRDRARRLHRLGSDRHPHPTPYIGWSVGVDRTLRPPPHQHRGPRPRRTHHRVGHRCSTRPTQPLHHHPPTGWM